MNRFKKALAATAVTVAILAGSIITASPAQAGSATCVRNAGAYGGWGAQYNFGISYNGWNYGPLTPAPNNGTACGVTHIVVYPWTCVAISPSWGGVGTYCAGASNRWIGVNWYGYGAAWRV